MAQVNETPENQRQFAAKIAAGGCTICGENFGPFVDIDGVRHRHCGNCGNYYARLEPPQAIESQQETELNG